MNTATIQQRKMDLRKKSDIPIALVLNVVLFLIGGYANGQVPQIAPEWKAHFTATPIIENCVFEDKMVWRNDETHLYQFRWQTNAFLFRQIERLSEADSNHISLTGHYVGRFEGNSWSIQGAGPSGQLFLFPNAGNIWGIMPKDANEMSLYIGEEELFYALYYGIINLNPTTLVWSENSKFTASSMEGGKMVGEITDVSNGLPTRLEWHFAKAPPDMGYILEYKYDNADFGLPYFPSEIDLFTKNGGEKQLANVFKILILKTSSTTMEESFFDSSRYFFPPSPSRHMAATLLFSNNELFDISQGYAEKVLSASDVKLLGTVKLPAAKANLVRLYFLGFLVLSIIGFLIIWKRTNTKQKNKNKPKE